MFKKLSRGTRWVITVLVCLLVFFGLAWFKFVEIKTAIDDVGKQPEYSETVETGVPKSVKYVPIIKTLGVVVAPQQLSLRNELPGYITAVNFSSGEIVEKNQVLLQLDISEQEANIASAVAKAELAQLIYERDLGLLKSNVVSQETIDRSRSELDVIQAEIAAINSVINRRTLRAPFGGVVGVFQYETGEYLEANTVITSLVGVTKEMWVDFSVPQFYGDLDPSQAVAVRILRAQPMDAETPLQAKIIASNSIISSTARSRLYRAVIEEGSQGLVHNMSVEIEVPVAQERSLFSIPTVAIQSDGAGEYVFLLAQETSEPTYRAKRFAVSIINQQDELSFVDELSENDLVATAGAFKLSAGMLVRSNTRPDLNSTDDGEE